jgi:hypothetical protein
MMLAIVWVVPSESVQEIPVRVSLPVLLTVAEKVIGAVGEAASAQVSATVSVVAVVMLQLLALESAETAVLLMAPLAEQVTESLKGLTDPM